MALKLFYSSLNLSIGPSIGNEIFIAFFMNWGTSRKRQAGTGARDSGVKSAAGVRVVGGHLAK